MAWQSTVYPANDADEYRESDDGEDGSGDNCNAGDVRGGTSKKRKADGFPVYAVCMRCGEEYDVDENDDGDCTWHMGKHVS
jgi:hypothetical protein